MRATDTSETVKILKRSSIDSWHAATIKVPCRVVPQILRVTIPLSLSLYLFDTCIFFPFSIFGSALCVMIRTLGHLVASSSKHWLSFSLLSLLPLFSYFDFPFDYAVDHLVFFYSGIHELINRRIESRKLRVKRNRDKNHMRVSTKYAIVKKFEAVQLPCENLERKEKESQLFWIWISNPNFIVKNRNKKHRALNSEKKHFLDGISVIGILTGYNNDG